jgi:hypothetical protein
MEISMRINSVFFQEMVLMSDDITCDDVVKYGWVSIRHELLYRAKLTILSLENLP